MLECWTIGRAEEHVPLTSRYYFSASRYFMNWTTANVYRRAKKILNPVLMFVYGAPHVLSSIMLGNLRILAEISKAEQV